MSAVPLLILIAFGYLNRVTSEKGSERIYRSVFLLSLIALLIRPFPGPVNAIRRGFAHNFQGQVIGADGYGSTPAELGATGHLFEKIRSSLDLPTLTVAIPDVGGTSLASPRTRIIDTGLLTSKELARNGYQYLPELLEREQPDIIETHGIWSKVSKIYNVKFFRENYVPIIANDHWLYLHKSHLARAKSLKKAPSPIRNAKANYRGHTYDEDFILKNHAGKPSISINFGH